jgi:hypothetical protein
MLAMLLKRFSNFRKTQPKKNNPRLAPKVSLHQTFGFAITSKKLRKSRYINQIAHDLVHGAIVGDVRNRQSLHLTTGRANATKWASNTRCQSAKFTEGLHKKARDIVSVFE